MLILHMQNVCKFVVWNISQIQTMIYTSRILESDYIFLWILFVPYQ